MRSGKQHKKKKGEKERKGQMMTDKVVIMIQCSDQPQPFYARLMKSQCSAVFKTAKQLRRPV